MATQARMGTPSARTAQAPQLESSQPRFDPVRPRSSRKTSRSSLEGGTATSRVSLLTLSWINSFVIVLRASLGRAPPGADGPRRVRSLHQFLERLFVEAQNDLVATNHHRTANQVWLLRHQLERFRSRGRLLAHVAPAIELVARVQKQFVVATANQMVEFRGRQSFLVEVAKLQVRPGVLQETSCIAAGGSCGLMQKPDGCFRHADYWMVPFGEIHWGSVA